MDKATKVAVEKHPHATFDGELGDSLRAACAIGYMQAEKNTIERIRAQVKQWMPEKDGKELTCGERLAFNSVLHLLEEMEDK